MRLLDVKAVLDREAHIQQADPEREILKELDDKGTRYAILSHRWGDEVGYEEMTGLMNMEERKRDQIRQRNGYQKIIKSCKQASKDGYELLWIDTCCIDKWSSSELSEAINSMYRWYQNAQVCYAYLNDVDESVFPAERNCDKFSESDGWPEWFMRGWTLQELIAPKQVEFFNKDWAPIGNKRHLAPTLEDITQIPWEVLRDGLAAKRLSVAQVMSWAAKRKTTRVEDRAYSLMGLFRVNMPMLYGEGKKAFQRLQLEIIRVSSDHSIFAWNPSEPRTGSVLAEDPSDFRSGSLIKIVKPDEFIDSLMALIEWNALSGPRHSHHRFRKILSNPIRWCRLAWLRWRARAISHRLRTISVTSSGIQVCLPVIPSRDSPSHLRAILPCGYVPFIIDLVSSGSNFERTSATARISAPTTTYPEFKTLCLTYHRDANETHREFALDDKYASYHGFTRCGTYPCEFTGDTVALSSLADDLIIIVYANDHNGSRFAVGLGYHLGQGWVHAVYDGCSPTQKDRIPWSNFAHGTFWRMWNARAEHVQSMPKQEYDDERRRNDHFIKHVHIPRSIWAARVVWGRWEMENFKIMVDVEQCPGCCDGPRGWATTCNEHCGFDTPGFMDTTCYPYLLRLDGWWAQFAKCSGPRIVLGDYGEYSDGNFKCTGNIFEDMRTLGNIDPTESVYQPLVCHVSGSGWLMRHVENHIDLAMVCHTSTEGNHLALRQPKGLRLPENGHFELLLKELAIRLAGKHLVISVIQCSSLYGVDIHGEARDSGDDSTIDGDNHSMQPRILTPLYIVVSPQVWQREMPCVQRREQFKSIREHFYALRQPTGVEVRHKSAVHRKTARTSIAHLGWHQNRQKKDGAIRFFSEMFCLHHLRNYVGKIFFFERLPSIMKSDSVSEVSTGSAEDGLPARTPKLPFADWVMTCNLFKGGQQSNALRDPHLEVVFPVLSKRCHTLCEWDDAPCRYANEKRKVERELKSILQTLSADLLQHILRVFVIEHASSWTTQAIHIEYDRRLDIPSVIEEIEALQAKLDATADGDEKRALEEDVTGKILWLCWCGICAEVDQLLPKVVDYIRREGNMNGLREIFMIIFPMKLIDSDDNQTHLRRVMLDAGVGTSKHRLWLAAQAAEQAKWSGATRDIVALDNEGPIPSTSTHPPSTSVV